MTKTQLFAILTAMTATAHNALAYEIHLEPDAAKRRTVTVYRSQGPETATLYLYAPTPWVIAGSAITAQDDNLWSGFNTTPNNPTHIYRMVNAHSSQQYVSIFGFLTQPGQGEGTPPWFRATVPSVDIDWEKHSGAGHESDEDTWTGVCPVTTNQSQRTKVIVRKLKDDRSLVAPSMTLECWPADAARFLKEDGVTALWSGATVSDSDTPLTLYVDPQPQYAGSTFTVTLLGPVDDAFNRPTDYLTGGVLKVDMDHDLWWFNGENPEGGYHITSTLTVTPVPTGTFKWDVIAGATKVDLNNGGADADSITATDDNTIDVKSTAASAGAATVTKDVRIQLTYNGVAVCTYDLAVFAPDHLVHLRDEDAADATWGYDTKIHYRIEDQFNQTLPYKVALNEDFTAAPTADYAGMDWRRGPEGGATVNPADWHDRVTGETSTHTPTPVGPTDPGAGTKVYHWPGRWNIGSTAIGNGVTVGSAHWGGSPTCVWQKYRGYADHE